MEKRKNVVWYEDKYKVSTLWRVYSIRNNKYLSLMDIKWYKVVKLHYSKTYVHRIVAEAFIKKIKNRNQINHKDWVKSNNSVDNLEWCNWSENCKHAYSTWLRMPIKWYKKVIQYTLDNKLVKIHNSIDEASKSIGQFPQCITWCCRWRQKTAWGYIRRYY